MSAQRACALLSILLERRRCTAAALARALGVSPTTVYRDVEALSAAGVPVSTLPGKGGGVFLTGGGVLDDPAFTPAHLQRLLAAAGPGEGGDAGPDGADDAVLARLGTLFRREEDWLQVELPRLGGRSEGELFDALRTAAARRLAVELTCTDGADALPLRLVYPLRLLFREGAWLLPACAPDVDIGLLRPLCRVTAAAVTAEHLRRQLTPPELPAPGEIPPLFRMDCTLRFSPAAAQRALELFDPACAEVQADGGVLVQAVLQDGERLHRCLLSFGGGVEVLAPAALRRRMACLARELAGLYPEGGA